MTIILVTLTILTLWAVAASVAAVRSDGYGRRPEAETTRDETRPP